METGLDDYDNTIRMLFQSNLRGMETVYLGDALQSGETGFNRI